MKLVRKILLWISKLFGGAGSKLVIKDWSKCTKSSNWTGKNASKRIMNILSPTMPDAIFNERYAFAKGRGVDHFNLFITNQRDGECAGYSIYGPNFAQSNGIDKNSTKIMEKRIKKIINDGYGVILWMTADDTSWNKTMNFEKLCADVKSLGWFDLCSAVVVGLECDEYWNASQVSNYCKILKKYSGKKVGVHQTSDKYNYMAYGDLSYLQVSPGKANSYIQNFIGIAKKAIGHPVCMFEMERSEDRGRSQAALDAGAFSVGNW